MSFHEPLVIGRELPVLAFIPVTSPCTLKTDVAEI